MGITDENGEGVIKVVAEDIDYRIGVYYPNGTLIKLADPSRLICLVSPCTYTLKVDTSTADYTFLFDVTYSLTYNTTTGIWNFVYNDASESTPSMNLTVYKMNPNAKILICSSTTTGVSGAISCNTSAYTIGTYKAEVSRTASPSIIIASKLVDLSSTPFKSSWGLFLMFIIATPIIFIFAYISPVIAIIGGIIAMIPAYLLGNISIVVFCSFIVLGGIVLTVLKRVD
jgi:hypothetical protein